jgi:acetylornithine deacetylase/succinyl-diaminopimelate desuccinylase-like protein
VPTAMLFIPSERGVSHSTAESSPEPSLTQGLQVLARAVERMRGALLTVKAIT